MASKREKPSQDFVVGIGFMVVTSAILGFAVFAGARASQPVGSQIFGALFLGTFPVVFARAAYKNRPRRFVHTEFEHGSPSQPKVEALLELGHHHQAELGAKELLASQPDDIGAHEALARSLLAKGQHRKARIAATEALRINPTSITALHVRVRANVRMKDRQQASTDLRSALALAPTNAALLNEQAMLHLSCHEESVFRSWTRAPFVSPHLKRADRAAIRGLSHEPSDVDLLCTLSFIQLLLGQNQKSRETALAAASADPSDPTAKFRVGCGEIACDEAEKGVRTLIELVAQDQNYGPYVASEFARLGRFTRRARQIPEELHPKIGLIRRTFNRKV